MFFYKPGVEYIHKIALKSGKIATVSLWYPPPPEEPDDYRPPYACDGPEEAEPPRKFVDIFWRRPERTRPLPPCADRLPAIALLMPAEPPRRWIKEGSSRESWTGLRQMILGVAEEVAAKN